MIKFDNVTKIFPDGTVALDNISFEIKKGEFICVVGKSGAGKTTLVHLILGLELATSGNVYFEDVKLNDADPLKIQEIRRKIGCIHQDYKLLPKKTVYENVAYIMQVEGKDNAEIEKEVPRVLDVIGLKDKVNNFPSELSGGEKQRLAIARALVNHPEIIIADEPTGNLDPYNSYEVISLLQKINQAGRTVILATHDREIINKLGKRVITIEKGEILRDEQAGRFII
ncbi:MAG: cell division ATP-binding protein FtsE [Candidatus Staskawiczbacteria bacterium]|nr:cell division ATP-binding protein FtsE [Candidatus Staskawiczbacteria bacterium]